MGVSIYYTAERTTLLTEQEQENITLIVDKYNESFEHTEEAESFDLYAYDDSESEVILAGATKISSSMDVEDLIYTLGHWLECLTEIRLAVADAEWHVHLDDNDAVWVDDKWQMEE
ncbi:MULTISPECIES: hypothetical protein [unclassified Psychrobacter]|uniref:hypothetical protein n=1 Tax=unclassified Psychrobacter TaxID=196806 RepID=UPI0018CEDBD5|nr:MULTISPECIES: hypothetical protein [unclassified Psychrobacter]MBH0064795.1 hypothetical protein [Psychrobacter sp. SZ93C1]MBH0096421.1 hypothetical protein [Psychrobacter sp. NZS113]